MGLNVPPKRGPEEGDSPRRKDNLERRGRHQEVHEERDAALDALKEQLDSGAITREQYREKRKELRAEVRDAHHVEDRLTGEEGEEPETGIRLDRRRDRRERSRDRQEDRHARRLEGMSDERREKKEPLFEAREEARELRHKAKDVKYRGRHESRHGEPLEGEPVAEEVTPDLPEDSELPKGNWNEVVKTWKDERQKEEGEESKVWTSYETRRNFYLGLINRRNEASFGEIFENPSEYGYSTFEEHKGKNLTHEVKKGDTLFPILQNFYETQMGKTAKQAREETFVTLGYLMAVTPPTAEGGPGGNVDAIQAGGKVTIEDGRLTIERADGEVTMDAAPMRQE